jgi:hypothetical protein
MLKNTLLRHFCCQRAWHHALRYRWGRISRAHCGLFRVCPTIRCSQTNQMGSLLHDYGYRLLRSFLRNCYRHPVGWECPGYCYFNFHRGGGERLGVALSDISPADGNALAKDVVFSACCLQNLYCKTINLPRNEKPRAIDC